MFKAQSGSTSSEGRSGFGSETTGGIDSTSQSSFKFAAGTSLFGSAPAGSGQTAGNPFETSATSSKGIFEFTHVPNSREDHGNSSSSISHNKSTIQQSGSSNRPSSLFGSGSEQQKKNVWDKKENWEKGNKGVGNDWDEEGEEDEAGEEDEDNSEGEENPALTPLQSSNTGTPRVEKSSSGQGGPNIPLVLEGAIGTEEHRRLLDKVDKLKELGVNRILALPQLVVTGDQSSGKSSVLEALTRLPFPRSSGLCTRFATEICLRRSPTTKPVKIRIKSNPFKSRPSPMEQTKLDAFTQEIAEKDLTTDKFMEILNKASELMGVPKPGQRQGAMSHKKGFSDDLLCIEMAGPQHAQFSVIDLPGLIRSVTDQQRRDDIDLIKKMNITYIQDKRSIILAVLSANVDAANQEVLQLAKDADKDGERTLGIITKPDRVEKGAENDVIRTACNRTYRLALGYFVVRNRGPSEMEMSAQDRDDMERTFFLQEKPWNTLPKERVGISSLKDFLGKLIYERIRRDIPQMQSEIEDHINTIQGRLDVLGRPRTSTTEQRVFLAAVATKAKEITYEAFHGRYEEDVFSRMDDLKLRQHARTLNQQLSEAFIKYGNTKGFSAVLNPRDNEEGEGGIFNLSGRFDPMPQKDPEIFRWIESREAQSRGPELPSLPSAHIHPRLFKEITENWNPIAQFYFRKLRDIVKKFHTAIMKEACSDPHVRDKLATKHNAEIFEIMREAELELSELIAAERTSILLTENPDFLQTVLSFRDGRLMSNLESVSLENPSANITPNEIRNQVLRNVRASINSNSGNTKIITIHDDLRAYYRISRRRVVDGIIVQIFERKVLRKLLDLYNFDWTASLTTEDLDKLASEPEATSQERRDLTDDLKTLKEALFTLD